MKFLAGLFTILLALSCQSGVEEVTTQEEEQEAPSELPFTSLALDDMSAFREVAGNWSVVGSVLSDHTQEQNIATEAGTGVLVNQNDDTNKDALATTWEHGDLELKLEFMMPKNSNSGIYFQGRYEVQLLDSWLKESPNFGDVGGIYERWDDAKPEGQQGYEGIAPNANAAKAPGLWQEFHIIFRAPRFDASGNKTENARFEKVVLNGIVIHEDMEVTGPTRAAFFEDEAPTGPLMIQGDHGPVAFRNVAYKRYFDEPSLDLANIKYQYFEIEGPITQLPDFDTMTVVKEGTTDSLLYRKLSERNEQVAYIFTGELQVPKAGDYLFTVYSDDGSQLFLDGDMLVDNDGKHDYEPKSGLIQLSEGSHEFRLTYFNNTWGQGLTVMYEGPEMRKQALLSEVRGGSRRDRPVMKIVPEEDPEMVRSFVMHQGKKLTHAMSVGDPSGLHYSLDLRRGALLQFWRGEFADVTEMWYQRGQPQLLQPLAMAVAANAGHLAAELSGSDAAYPTDQDDQLSLKAYDINEDNEPVFNYAVGGTIVSDHYEPADDGQELIRTIRTEKGSDKLFTRLAADDYIKPVGNGYYSVGGRYYIRFLDDSVKPVIRENGGHEEMLFALTDSSKEVKYAILW
ncbi:family 16 glycoside hydrolase [Flavilitoribacter nigricans]|nr:family 16 glycoside hydrolase [Flavilitoribacter nigricans]